MNYQSTRGADSGVTAARAIVKGLAGDRGLFVPDEIPRLDAGDLAFLSSCNYLDAAKLIFERYLEDFSLAQIDECVEGAYYDTFDSAEVAPLVKLDEDTRVLELWHGPTCAFKDLALQVLPRLTTAAAAISGEQNEIVILVATSGDTGKAALEGFRDVPGTSIVVLYPQDGVSAVQKQQMVTQEGENVRVLAIRGNFDDAQNAVKGIFMDDALAGRLLARKKRLGSANSINWGRLLPQIVYYARTAAQLTAPGAAAAGSAVDFVVPTGNFGNILAAWYAKQMGAPVGRLICASNENDVLTEFLTTGIYDRRRPFHKTLSPSMDILVSSNLERLLYELSGRDSALIRGLMQQLETGGRYEVPDSLKAGIRRDFCAGCCDDAGTQAAIRDAWQRYHYLMDTHTAVAYSVLNALRGREGTKRPTVIASTASPFKFPAGVLCSIAGGDAAAGLSEYRVLDRLSAVTGWPVPDPIAGLEHRAVRHTAVCDAADISAAVEAAIG